MTAPAAALPPPRLHWSGDTLILIEVGAAMALDVNARAIALAAVIAEADVRGVRDVVPAYASVGVHVDPLRFDQAGLDAVIARTTSLVTTTPSPREVDIPVRYGGPDGPDLADVAAFAGCSADEVVARHARGRYHVYMLGFLPGFAYLGGVEASIGMPRRSSPRPTVPPGSVGIAGAQTGVYPYASPGGWQLIGRTPLVMFDPARATPALLAPGDTVRFVPMTDAEWERLGGARR